MTPEQRAERLHHHMYETCEGIREQSERIVALEELVVDLLKTCYDAYEQVWGWDDDWAICRAKAEKLGVPL